MSVSVSPHTRFAAALIAAGVVSAASVVSLPAPTMSIDVANASVVTDALSSFGKGVEVLSSLVGIHADAVVSLPFEASLAVMAAAQHPELGANVLSYLVQRFVNPAVGAPIYAYPWETEQTAALVASLLPYPLGPSATDIGLVNQARFDFAAAFDNVLGRLADPLPGFDAVTGVMNDTVLGGAVVAGQLAVRAPIYMAWNTVNYLGNLPVNVEASLESAIQTPAQIPGLISNLVYGLLSPDAQVGLFGQLLNNVVDPLTWLPAPIGYGSAAAVGLANQVRAAITDVVNRVLSLLPAPVRPAALPTSTAAQGQPIYSVGAGKGDDAPDALPSATVALTDSVVVAPAKNAEKQTKTTVSKVEAPAVSDVQATVADAPVDSTTSVAAAPSDTPAGSEEAAASDKPEKDGKDGDVKVRPTKVRHADGTVKDHPTRPSTVDHESTPDKAEPSKTGPAKTEHSDAGESTKSSGAAA